MDDEELNALRAKRMAELQGQGVRILFSFRIYQVQAFQGFFEVSFSMWSNCVAFESELDSHSR